MEQILIRKNSKLYIICTVKQFSNRKKYSVLNPSLYVFLRIGIQISSQNRSESRLFPNMDPDPGKRHIFPKAIKKNLGNLFYSQKSKYFYKGQYIKIFDCWFFASNSFSEAKFLVGFEGLASTLRIGLAVGRLWPQNH